MNITIASDSTFSLTVCWDKVQHAELLAEFFQSSNLYPDTYIYTGFMGDTFYGDWKPKEDPLHGCMVLDDGTTIYIPHDVRLLERMDVSKEGYVRERITEMFTKAPLTVILTVDGQTYTPWIQDPYDYERAILIESLVVQFEAPQSYEVAAWLLANMPVDPDTIPEIPYGHTHLQF